MSPRTAAGVPYALTDAGLAGGFWVFARPKNAPVTDVTFFRGIPSVVGGFSFTDPGGPNVASITFGQISMFERLGAGDLHWLAKKVSFDIVWAAALPAAYPVGRYGGAGDARVWLPAFAWEGQVSAFGYSAAGLEVSLQGALRYGLDDYLAKAEFPTHPMPYEHAIARQFLERPHSRLAPLQIVWPDWWDTTYTPPAKSTPGYLVPSHVTRGQKWSGLLTRDTGSFVPVWSSYIITMLSAMYTRRGRFTIDLARGRVPVMFHRDMLVAPDDATVILDLASPQVKVGQLSVDWSQAIDVAYAQGVSLAGVAYSGMNVSNDGARTAYVPFATKRQAYPTEDNPWLDLAESPREVLLQMPPGLSAYDAAKVAAAHLERFGDPGVTGELILQGDVALGDGSVIPYYLVRAGMSVQARNAFGVPKGFLAHISDNTVDLIAETNTITVDSKYRDALTVEEVRLRGRDAMNISRMLIGGQYTPPIPDQLVPWNYAEGSGMIPSGPNVGMPNARDLFDGMPDDIRFPWTKWTTARPPKVGRFKHCYIHIGPADGENADNNWAFNPRRTGGHFAIPIKMAQAGSIRLLQVAAYDKDGNVFPVRFHISFYYMNGANVQAMPKISAGDPHPPYDTGDHYPFVTDAFEQYNADGTEKGTEIPMTVQTALLWKAFGTDRVKAGYFPGDGSGVVTGLLVDENIGSFDTSVSGDINPYSRKQTGLHGDPGYLYAMVYCDEQGVDDVYFLGRMFRAEPGTQGGGQ